MLQTFDIVGPKRFRFDRPVLYSNFRDALTAVEDTRGKSGLVVHEVTGDPVSLIFEQPIIMHAMGAIPVGLINRQAAPRIDGDLQPARLRHADLAPEARQAEQLQPAYA